MTTPEKIAVMPPPVGSAGVARQRFDSIDLLRGLVMVIMALDHVRGNFSNFHNDLTNVDQTTVAMFLTRWITHFCAPTFVFLAGSGAFLFGSRGKSTKDLAWFLLTRGLWLIILELTVIRFSWFFNLDYHYSFGQVIWAIGWSMVTMSGLVFLPVSAITAFGLALILFHNLFDYVRPQDWGKFSWLWIILHTGDKITVADNIVFHPFYPLIPWIGVVAAGYGFGAYYLLPTAKRRREILALGIVLTLVFVALRYSNLYGDKLSSNPAGPGPWSVQKGSIAFAGDPIKPGAEVGYVKTLFSFVNCQKYPPSLVFLLMTLGPAIIGLAIFDRREGQGPIGRFFVTLGRVPMFYYLIHWFLIRFVVMGLAYQRYGWAEWLFQDPFQPPKDYGYDLWVVYLIWLGIVLALYPLCRWFAGVKQRRRDAWLSYF